MKHIIDINRKAAETVGSMMKISGCYINGLSGYVCENVAPAGILVNSFATMELEKILNKTPATSLADYISLICLGMDMAKQRLSGSIKCISDYHSNEYMKFFKACVNSMLHLEGEDLTIYLGKLSRILENLAYEYPRQIQEIRTEYGFHFDDDGYEKVAETNRFVLYRVMPTAPGCEIDMCGKPVMIFPPYVLGENILAFLPGENKSYVHSFANCGVPTYIRILKDIHKTPAVQVMTGEEDAIDSRYFCNILKNDHGMPVTLNGYCQGGYVAMLNVLSGCLDGLADSLITCVAPMDGTKNRTLTDLIDRLPEGFRHLNYSQKTLPGGNRVIDAGVMSLLLKLKSIGGSEPLSEFYHDLFVNGEKGDRSGKMTKTAAAINHWLQHDRRDLPVEITKLSFDSYTRPVDKSGTLPVKLFGRELNFRRIREKGVKMQICYARKDDLVDSEAILAPLDFIDAEVTAFPKGHVAMATSWSHPDSEYALHKSYENGMRGPVRFHLDLMAEEKKSYKGRASA